MKQTVTIPISESTKSKYHRPKQQGPPFQDYTILQWLREITLGTPVCLPTRLAQVKMDLGQLPLKLLTMFEHYRTGL